MSTANDKEWELLERLFETDSQMLRDRAWYWVCMARSAMADSALLRMRVKQLESSTDYLHRLIAKGNR